ncbi:MAG: hypothetical protein J6S67_06470 [Methanobrevibacter sp.]|nr:hypothetical protein [Methanobrevibacter sp.]
MNISLTKNEVKHLIAILTEDYDSVSCSYDENDGDVDKKIMEFDKAILDKLNFALTKAALAKATRVMNKAINT